MTNANAASEAISPAGQTRVWDPLIRIFHWSIVIAFTANALFVEGDSKIHLWIGYFVAGAVAFRIVWGFIGTKYARFSNFPPNLKGASEQVMEIASNRKRLHMGHTPLGALMIYNLLLTLIVIAASGYLMTTDAYWGVRWMEELHEAAVFWAEFSVALHIAAVIFESLRLKVNLPKAMVTGVKEFRN